MLKCARFEFEFDTVLNWLATSWSTHKNDEIWDIPNTKTIPAISVPLNQNVLTIQIANSNSNSNGCADSIRKTKKNQEREEM